MRTYDMRHLSGDLKSWMSERFLLPILSIEGGWEYWIQIDFPAWLDVSRQAQFDFRREQDLGSGRVDWLINSTGESLGIGVELKAQTHKYLSARFVQDVFNDVNKLKAWGQEGKIAGGVAVAAAVDPNVVDKLAAAGFSKLFMFERDVAFLALALGAVDAAGLGP